MCGLGGKGIRKEEGQIGPVNPFPSTVEALSWWVKLSGIRQSTGGLGGKGLNKVGIIIGHEKLPFHDPPRWSLGHLNPVARPEKDWNTHSDSQHYHKPHIQRKTVFSYTINHSL